MCVCVWAVKKKNAEQRFYQFHKTFTSTKRKKSDSDLSNESKIHLICTLIANLQQLLATDEIGMIPDLSRYWTMALLTTIIFRIELNKMNSESLS